MELTQLESVELFMDTVTSQEVYLNALFPSRYRYYFELVSNTDTPILMDHPFRLYFPGSLAVEWAPPNGTNGIYLVIGADPAFMSFGPLAIRIYLSQEIYDTMITAMLNPINSLEDLVPPPDASTCGEVEFVFLSTDTGYQIKLDLVNHSYTPEIPVTVHTLQWNEPLYWVMKSVSPAMLPPPPPSAIDLQDFEFDYTLAGDLGITFVDRRYCFLREWIQFPPEWTSAIKSFAGV